VGVGSEEGGGAAELLEVLKVPTERLAQAPELGLAPVLLAELEGAGSNVVVDMLQARVGFQNVQHCSVHFPQELQRGQHDGSVSPLGGVGGGHG